MKESRSTENEERDFGYGSGKYLYKFRKDGLAQGSAKLFSEAPKPTAHRQNRWQYLQTDATIRAGEKGLNNSAFSSTKGLCTGFGQDELTKKRQSFDCLSGGRGGT